MGQIVAFGACDGFGGNLSICTEISPSSAPNLASSAVLDSEIAILSRFWSYNRHQLQFPRVSAARTIRYWLSLHLRVRKSHTHELLARALPPAVLAEGAAAALLAPALLPAVLAEAAAAALLARGLPPAVLADSAAAALLAHALQSAVLADAAAKFKFKLFY